MVEARSFFDELMSPFNFLPLLEFTFEGGIKTKQGSQFFKILFYNLFIALPEKAKINVDDFETY